MFLLCPTLVPSVFVPLDQRSRQASMRSKGRRLETRLTLTTPSPAFQITIQLVISFLPKEAPPSQRSTGDEEREEDSETRNLVALYDLKYVIEPRWLQTISFKKSRKNSIKTSILYTLIYYYLTLISWTPLFT